MNAETRILGEDSWSVGGRTFSSRLIVGTGKYKSFEQNAAAVEASGAEIVTVAVRRARPKIQGVQRRRVRAAVRRGVLLERE